MQKGTGADEKSKRIRERIALALPVRVYCRESSDYEWDEMSRLVDVTPFGARLRLKRPMETGRLLRLVMAMPRQLRCFDHVEDQYRVWSLVRNVRLLDPAATKGALVELGVAFVGKYPPRSYEANPSTRYEIPPRSAESGLWVIHEQTEGRLSEMADTDKRKETRHVIPVEILIEVFGRDGGFTKSESTVTENISEHGAAVFTTLDLSPGCFVRVSSPQSPTALLAVVRKRRCAADGIFRLHLEFVGAKWAL
jgi:hypothetical protein